jgi:(p)ppGpp synthase/HD superfamily hydrolase
MFYIPTPDFIKGNDLLIRAFQFAQAAHAEVEQTRKYTGEPYIVHPVEVAEIVFNQSNTDDSQVAAAFLHDTVEDTRVTIRMVHAQFGADVGTLVDWLTDISKSSDGNRATRKAIDRAHSARAPARAQTVKVADLISNTRSITEYDPNFAVVYITEKSLLLDALTDADPELVARARDQIRRFQEASLQNHLGEKA